MFVKHNFGKAFSKRSTAIARIVGSKKYPAISGIARFYQTEDGVLVVTEISGLPYFTENSNSPIFAYHIHEGESCSGDENDAFLNTGMHYNPTEEPHPYHAGDMPPLFGVRGYAFSAFLTMRFNVREIIGKTVVIHLGFDDFSSQPSGNAGEKIACGEILDNYMR